MINYDWKKCIIFIGINPIWIKTATHETLTVNYAEASFKTVVTRDVSTLMLYCFVFEW